MAFLLVDFEWYDEEEISRKKNEHIVTKQINKSELEIDQINFLMFHIDADELHNTPLSGNTPKIQIIAGNKIFITEIIRGVINTTKKDIGKPDLIITGEEKEFINVINSNPKESVQKAVEKGDISVQVVSNYKTLYLKGYLKLYKKLTGKNLSDLIKK